jgi:hypothetical protein
MKKRVMKERFLLIFLYTGLIFQDIKTSFESSCFILLMRETGGIWNLGMLLLRILFCTYAVELIFILKSIFTVSSIAVSFMSTEFEDI